MDLKELEKKMKGTNYVVMTKDGMLMKYNNVGMVLAHLSQFINAVKDDVDKDMLNEAIKLGFKSDKEISDMVKQQTEIKSKINDLKNALNELFKKED